MTLESTATPATPAWAFPCLGVSKDGAIALFNEDGLGMVIRPSGDHAIGETNHTAVPGGNGDEPPFYLGDFTPYFGAVTITS